MEPRVSLITLGVSDLERSLRFYRDGLGLPTSWGTEKGVIFFRTSGVVLALYPHADLAKDVGYRRVGGGGDSGSMLSGDGPEPWEYAGGRPVNFSGITLAHNVRTKGEVDELLAQAERAGGTVVKRGQDAFWGGYSGYFADPDGYLWEVAWGAFPIREDGSLEVP